MARNYTKTNPIEELINISAQFKTTLDTIINNSDNEDFIASLSSLKEKYPPEVPESTKRSKTLNRILDTLDKYPGLEKQVDDFLKAKINEYTMLKVIDHYKPDSN